MNSRPEKIGLALGSGAARGWAHIGVIRALRAHNVRIDCIAGTSIGALVGAAYAGGDIDNLYNFVKQLDWKQLINFWDPVFPKTGLIDGKKVADFIRDHSKKERIEDMPVPFRTVSTNILTGREHVFTDGDVISVVRASLSIPGMFTPMKHGDMVLVDGALVNPLPINVVRDMGADFVIAVDINFGTEAFHSERLKCRDEPDAGIVHEDLKFETAWEQKLAELGKNLAILEFNTKKQLDQWVRKESIPNIFEILMQSYNVLEVQITETRLKTDPADVLIRPKLAHIGLLDFNCAEESIEEGYRSTVELIEKLPVDSSGS